MVHTDLVTFSESYLPKLRQPALSGFAATQSGPSQFGVDGAADDEDFPASFYYKENEEDDSQTVANSPSPLAYQSH